MTKVDFRAFLPEVNTARRAVTEDGEGLDGSACIPDFRERNGTYPQAELERLPTPHKPEADLTAADWMGDAEAFFTLLKTTSGAYILPLRDVHIGAAIGRPPHPPSFLSAELIRILFSHPCEAVR